MKYRIVALIIACLMVLSTLAGGLAEDIPVVVWGAPAVTEAPAEAEAPAEVEAPAEAVGAAVEDAGALNTWESGAISVVLPDEWEYMGPAEGLEGSAAYVYNNETFAILAEAQWLDESSSSIDDVTLESLMGMIMNALSEQYQLNPNYTRQSTPNGIICLTLDAQKYNKDIIDLGGDYMGIGVICKYPTQALFICGSTTEADCAEAMNAIVKGLAANEAFELELPELNLGELKRGDKSDEVNKLQSLLIAHNYLKDKADGVFGNNTERAVKTVQADAGLPQTGVVDAQTLKYLQGNSRSFVAESDSDIILLGATYEAETGLMGIKIKNMGRQTITEIGYNIYQCNESKGAIGDFYGNRDTKRKSYYTTVTTGTNLMSGLDTTRQYLLLNGAQVEFGDGSMQTVTWMDNGVYARVTLNSFTTADGKKHSTNQTVYARIR